MSEEEGDESDYEDFDEINENDDDDETGYICGPDSEEILSELVTLYSPRNTIQIHRAILQCDEDSLQTLITDPDSVEATLLPLDSFDEVRKCNNIDMDILQTLPCMVIPREDYPSCPQFVTGDSAEPNELYPNGDIGEPETNLDTAFWTPLLRACQCGNVRIIQFLLVNGANPNYRSPCGVSALTALLNGHGDSQYYPEIIRHLATPENMQNECLVTSILGSEDISNAAEVVRTLLQCGAQLPDGFLMEDLSWLDPEVVQVLQLFG